MPEVAALVLAAGRAARFGSDKLLQPLTLAGVTQPVLLHSLAPWLQVFPEVRVVVRPQHAALRAALAGLGARVVLVEAEAAALGMGHSLADGVAASQEAGGWLVGLGDMPLLPAAVIAAVRDQLLAGARLSSPICNGRRGHPVGFAASYRAELLALAGDSGAREILRRDAEQLVALATQHPGVLIDIDQPSDLDQLTDR